MIKKILFHFILVFILQTAFAQKRSRDLLVLKNGNALAGKVLKSDSFNLTLRRADRSTEKYSWQAIDSVRGLALRTPFFSPILGFTHINYWSTLQYKKIKDNAVSYTYRLGGLVSGHWSRWVQLSFVHSQPFKSQRLGIGFSYYFPFEYIEPICFYAGADANFSFVTENRSFFSMGLHPGVEYWHKKDSRFFVEMDLQRAIFNINQNASFSFRGGIRFSKELSRFYRKVNTTHKVPERRVKLGNRKLVK